MCSLVEKTLLFAYFLFYLGEPTKHLSIGNTWRRTVKDAVIFAIDAGYHHFNCAYLYKNESEIRDALQEKNEEDVVRQEDPFIVSPWCRNQATTLAALQLDYLDLYLIHWPMGFKILRLKLLGAMEDLVYVGMVKATGVSNCKQIDQLLNNQINHSPTHHHPSLPQEELMKFCQCKQISVTAYCPPGVPNWPWSKPQDTSLFDDPQIKETALKYNKIPAQLLIWLQIQRNVCVITKFVSPRNTEENFKLRGYLTKLLMVVNFTQKNPLCHWNTVPPSHLELVMFVSQIACRLLYECKMLHEK
uniref:NADP-dependent oxidoreductase domain-containing protein n=1 Tax=Athene cunicularia TaxID=194338 RepID=A0A663MWP1_ATHCN